MVLSRYAPVMCSRVHGYVDAKSIAKSSPRLRPTNPPGCEMADRLTAEYASALEQACVQLKMLQCALWTKDKIDEDDEAALQSAMMAVRALQKHVTTFPPKTTQSADTVKPQKARRSWSSMLGRSFRKVVGKRQRDPAVESKHRELSPHRTGTSDSVASTTSSVVQSQEESFHEHLDDGSFVSDEAGTFKSGVETAGSTKMRTSPPPRMLGAVQPLGRSPSAGAQRDKEDLERLEAQVERALTRVLIEFGKKSSDGGESIASLESTATGHPSEHRASRDLTAEINDLSSSSSSPTAAKRRVVQLAASEVMAALVNSVAAAVEEMRDEDASNPPSQRSNLLSEPDASFTGPEADRPPSDLLESTVAAFTSFMQALSQTSSPSKSIGSATQEHAGEAAVPSGVCEAPVDPAVKVRDEEVGEIGDEMLLAIALVQEEEASPQATPSKTPRAPRRTLDL